MSTSSAITVAGLHKSFGSTVALDGLDLEVRAGEVHGFLGPNGSGKSVTIRILLGLLRADSGQLEVLGGDPWSDAVELHRRIAYVPGEVNLWRNLSWLGLGPVLLASRRTRTRANARTCRSSRRRGLALRQKHDPRPVRHRLPGSRGAVGAGTDAPTERHELAPTGGAEGAIQGRGFRLILAAIAA